MSNNILNCRFRTIEAGLIKCSCARVHAETVTASQCSRCPWAEDVSTGNSNESTDGQLSLPECQYRYGEQFGVIDCTNAIINHRSQIVDRETCLACTWRHLSQKETAEKSRGLGDTIAKVTKAVGIKPCGGCKDRMVAINKIISYDSEFYTEEIREGLKRTLAVIPIYGRQQMTHDIVMDIYREGVDVIIIDNKGDYTPIINEVVLRPGKNLGWLRGNNYAIQQFISTGKYDRFVLLNNDMRLSVDYFAGLIWSEKETGSAIVASSYNGFWDVQHVYCKDAREYTPKKINIPYGSCDGCCVSVRREVFEKCGYLSAERFGKYGWAAMSDLCFRARLIGLFTTVTRASWADHLNGGHLTASDVFGDNYNAPASAEGQSGMTTVWGSKWMNTRHLPSVSDCVIYTCLTANRDNLSHFRYRVLPAGWKVVCYTDNLKAVPIGWEGRSLQWKDSVDPRRIARWHKLHPHVLFPDHEYSIWMDASMSPESNGIIADDWRTMLWYLGDGDITAFKHFERTCLYKEAKVCKSLKLDLPEVIDKQVKRYLDEKFPVNAGLYETGVMVRRHHACKELSELWWEHIVRYSKRDQISLPFVANLLGVKIRTIPFDIRNNHLWKMKKHNK